MIPRDSLVEALDDLLQPENGSVDDVSNNGLQVEGMSEVRRAVFGVDACRDLFERAVAESADFVFVHHGLSWGGGLKRLTGMTAGRLRPLFENGISLYASHLPLDMHPELGHNAVMARELGIQHPEPFFRYGETEIGWGGDLPEAAAVRELAERLDEMLDTDSYLVGDPETPISRVGIVSGGGADAVSECAEAGYGCLITGEMKHSEYHTASELDVCVVAGGHYCTEMPGVKAVMEWVEENFDVECSFVDLPTGL